MMEIFRSPLMVIRKLPGSRVVLFKRLPERSGDLAVTRAAMEGGVKVLEALPRTELCVLIDVREAPPLVDSGFEALLASMRPRLFRGFARVAVLIATSVGKLQINRLAREDGIEYRVFSDEGEAMSYLTDLPRAAR